MQKRAKRNAIKAESQEEANKTQLVNSFEVISDGKLGEISRPSSRSSATSRGVSQLSMQSRMSFELEMLPAEMKDESSHDFQENDMFLEEAVDDEDSFDENQKRVKIHAEDRQGTKGFVEEELNSKEFEKEILKISKRVARRKHYSPPTAKATEEADATAETNGRGTPSGETAPGPEASTEEQKEEEKEVDPKIRKGLEKIKKLDNILAEKIKLEKEAKADRKRMEREWQLEIKSFVEWCGDSKSKPIIQQFLALTNGIDGGNFEGNRDYDDDVTPLFATEVDTDLHQESNREKDFDPAKENSAYENEEPSSGRKSNEDSESDRQSTKKSKGKKKNFLKRNIELAGHANEIVSLTESEKQRLDELLADDTDLLMVENPFTKLDHPKIPVGFEFDDHSRVALTDIDEKLKMLVPESDFQSICFSPVTDSNSLRSHRSYDLPESAAGNANEDNETKCGEDALQQGKDYRHMKERLQQIEAELNHLGQSDSSEIDADTPRISNDLLRQLLEVDSRLTSSALSILNSARSKLSERSDSPTLTYDSESVFDTSRSFETEKSFHSVGV